MKRNAFKHVKDVNREHKDHDEHIIVSIPATNGLLLKLIKSPLAYGDVTLVSLHNGLIEVIGVEGHIECRHQVDLQRNEG